MKVMFSHVTEIYGSDNYNLNFIIDINKKSAIKWMSVAVEPKDSIEKIWDMVFSTAKEISNSIES